jgi:glycoside/pentoside/hexuronide:cation symporter, GPH family
LEQQVNPSSAWTNRNRKLSFKEKFCFGMGDVTGTFGTSVISLYYLKYLTDILGLGAALAGVVMFITNFYNAVNDPFIGHLSDSTRSRWGRRRFYLLFFGIPTGITYYLLWVIPRGWSLEGKFAAAIAASIIYWTFFSLVSVPYCTLTVEMTDNYDERSKLAAYRMFVSIIGGLLAIAIPSFLVPDLKPDASNITAIHQGYLSAGIIIAVIVGLAPFLPFWGCKERHACHVAPGGVRKLAATYLAMMKNRPFCFATLSYMFTWGGFSVMTAFFPYYLESWLKIRDQMLFLLIVALLFVAAAAFVPLWLVLMRKIGKKAAYNLGMGALALCSMLIMLVQPGQTVLIFIMVLLLSIGVSAAHVVPQSIIPDTIDISRLATGYDAEGVYYGFQSFIQQVATAGFVGLAGIGLGLCGYIKLDDLQPGQAQPNTAIWAIRLIFSAIPAVFMGIGVIMMLFMKLDRKTHEQTIAAINSREEQDHAASD